MNRSRARLDHPWTSTRRSSCPRSLGSVWRKCSSRSPTLSSGSAIRVRPLAPLRPPQAERAIRRAEILAEQLQGALNSRVVIEQAKGALSRIHGVDVDHAFQMMRAYARSTGHKLGEVAHAVVTEPASLPS